MKIGIIVEPYEEKNASGIAHCILAQTEELSRHLTSEDELIVYTSCPIQKDRLHARMRNVVVPSSALGKNIWFLAHWMMRSPDVPEILSFNMPLLPMVLPKSIKTVPTFYELIFETPGRKTFLSTLIGVMNRLLVRWATGRAALVVTPSMASFHDIKRAYNVADTRIQNIYIGFQDLSLYQSEALPIDDAMKPYFFFVGKVKHKKNVHGMIEGFIAFKKQHHTNHKFIVAGDYGGAYFQDIQKRLREEGFEKDLIMLGYRYDRELYGFYKNATALVFCTFQEGFGMPVVEAMHLGVPVITSNCSSMKELADGVGELADPHNAPSIARAMERVALDDAYRAQMIDRGFLRAKDFSWARHGDELYKVMRRAL